MRHFHILRMNVCLMDKDSTIPLPRCYCELHKSKEKPLDTKKLTSTSKKFDKSEFISPFWKNISRVSVRRKEVDEIGREETDR